MIDLNKQRVAALLKIVGKDSTRPVLENLYIKTIDGQMVAIGTDGYVMAILAIDNEDGAELNNKFIRRSALEKWYKLAGRKDRLTTEELVKLSAQDYADNGSYYEGEYPDIMPIVQKAMKGEASHSITFNAEYTKMVQDLADKPVTYTLNGKLGALLAQDDGNKYIIMPLKG